MRGRGRNAQVVCAGRCVSRVFSHHTRNVVHGYSLCLVLLLLLQPAARRPLQPPSYCLAASLLFTSPFHGNSPKSRGIFPSVGLGRLFPECLSTLLREVQAARRCTGRLLQAHSPPTVSVSGLGRPRVADRLATIHSACRLHQYALVLLPTGSNRRASNRGTLCRGLPRANTANFHVFAR